MEEDSKGTDLGNVILSMTNGYGIILVASCGARSRRHFGFAHGQALNAMLEAEADRLCNATLRAHADRARSAVWHLRRKRRPRPAK